MLSTVLVIGLLFLSTGVVHQNMEHQPFGACSGSECGADLDCIQLCIASITNIIDRNFVIVSTLAIVALSVMLVMSLRPLTRKFEFIPLIWYPPRYHFETVTLLE